MRKGYDFNGVVDTGEYRPGAEDVIITGNTIPLALGVLQWLREHNINCPVYFMPDDKGALKPRAVAVWKSEMVRRLKLQVFYEDQPIQAEIIQESCPDCKVILTKGYQ